MATTDTLSPESEAHDDHGHDHDHPAWLAHHFDTPEQQFDSGKLGIWLFLTTEILFFSGMFCAYAMFRMLRPEIFEGSSQFLDTKLGAINTGVLLFSSLTMAWAVRCAQTEEHKKLVVMIASTLSCAMVFLGVKTIEYSHKWGMGLLPPGTYFYDESNPHPTAEQLVSQHGFTENTAYFLTHSLYFLCAPFLLVLIGVVIWAIIAKVKKNEFQFACAKPLVVVCLSFFGGVGLGMILTGSEEHGSGEHIAAAHEGAEHSHIEHGATAADEHDNAVDVAATYTEPTTFDASRDDAAVELLAESDLNTGAQAMLAAKEQQATLASGKVVAPDAKVDMGIHRIERSVETKRQAGVFFGIYYCMTGVHAIHILGGIGVLVWLLVRAIRKDFNRQYFGPVDYIGLYWHLVDLIWIYLFPLLYLIR
ncbi:cytochrome c oxidase subunit 3 [Allorhodopirellula heiligendammensis]|uniref:Cytochrome c oxidase subunit 3 n=1 Tax=Allorhodopirellula heiligendammensis TaxID=2714739 RepID=A0A5C6BTU7_9BACT|nr:cytochrome c oxidase subunit 3 [Allorhodopirellula heiligendammensis]TWU15448.1 Cytochrome c oxidase subunit 3 [Allorhodopirellula heiligendammensis]